MNTDDFHNIGSKFKIKIILASMKSLSYSKHTSSKYCSEKAACDVDIVPKERSAMQTKKFTNNSKGKPKLIF